MIGSRIWVKISLHVVFDLACSRPAPTSINSDHSRPIWKSTSPLRMQNFHLQDSDLWQPGRGQGSIACSLTSRELTAWCEGSAEACQIVTDAWRSPALDLCTGCRCCRVPKFWLWFLFQVRKNRSGKGRSNKHAVPAPRPSHECKFLLAHLITSLPDIHGSFSAFFCPYLYFLLSPLILGFLRRVSASQSCPFIAAPGRCKTSSATLMPGTLH